MEVCIVVLAHGGFGDDVVLEGYGAAGAVWVARAAAARAAHNGGRDAEALTACAADVACAAALEVEQWSACWLAGGGEARGAYAG